MEEETYYPNTHNNNYLNEITVSAMKENFWVLGELTAWLLKFPFREKRRGCPRKEKFRERDTET